MVQCDELVITGTVQPAVRPAAVSSASVKRPSSFRDLKADPKRSVPLKPKSKRASAADTKVRPSSQLAC